MTYRSAPPCTPDLPRRLVGPGSLALALLAAPLLSAVAQVAPAPRTTPATAAAAATPAKEETIALQRFVVTGSNIERLDLEKVVPVSIVDQDAITARGAVLPADLLTSLPSVVNLPENETRLGSSGARGDNANLNLRNMGATATLILVNGRRMAVNPMTAGLSQAVNVNQLPTRGIERIEVLRDGASSIYGSDAVGGVINYVLRRQFDGSEASLRIGAPEHGGGESVQGSYTFGTSLDGGRGRIFGTIEALYRDALFLTERDFSRFADSSARAEPPFNVAGGPFDARSARGYWPTFRIGTGTAANYFRPVNGTPALTAVAPTRTANPEFFLDLNQFGMAAPRTRRSNAFVSGEFDVSERITAFADVSYYTALSTMRRQPLALNAPTSDQLMVMAIDNPFNPYGSRFYSATGTPNSDGTPRLTGAPRTISFTAMTLAGLAAESVDTRADVIRLAAGLKGRLGGSWSWEGSGFYNRVKGSDEAFRDVRESRLQQVLQRTDANAYNPFGYTFKVENNAVVAIVRTPTRRPSSTPSPRSTCATPPAPSRAAMSAPPARCSTRGPARSAPPPAPSTAARRSTICVLRSAAKIPPAPAWIRSTTTSSSTRRGPMSSASVASPACTPSWSYRSSLRISPCRCCTPSSSPRPAATSATATSATPPSRRSA